jgi:ABC-type enterochelin transport system substrate-binding protein
VQDKIVVVDRDFQIVEKFTQKPVVVEKEVIRQVPVMVEKTVVVNNDVPHVYEI